MDCRVEPWVEPGNDRLWFGINAHALAAMPRCKTGSTARESGCVCAPIKLLDSRREAGCPPAQVAALYCLIDSRESDPMPVGLLPVYCRL